MKLKELDRNGNVAWSPKLCNSSYLAVGTASQQLDSSFSTNAQLEIFKYVPNQTNWDMPVVASVSSDTKFSKLLWGNVQTNNGYIIGGSDNGAISIYDASLLLENGKSTNANLALIATRKEHKGAINAMDFNKFKPNLLATGSADSDIFIWDLDKLEEPMKPGNKTQPSEDILSLAWNHKVQHILASTSTHRCQIWDLRKDDPVIKLSDSQMKIKCKKVVWHPDISTRLCVSSEDDHTPVIQLWDLRYMQCPFHTLQKHTKGIVDLDWCLDDYDILMSVGKDRQLICWNMSTQHLSTTPSDSSSDVIYEWQLDQDWINEARFCPKYPGLVSISSFDCHIGVYSLLGGRGHVPRELSETVTDSFPLDLCNDEGQESEMVKKEAEKAAELQLPPTPCLSKAPKWLKRPIGARFSFGGKLVQFYKPEISRSRNNSESQSTASLSNDCQYKVIISQVVTDKNLVHDSNMLLNAIESPGVLLNYCKNKVEMITNRLINIEYGEIKSELQFDRNIWKFIECHFEEDSRSAFMNNLGYSETNFLNMAKISDISDIFLSDDKNDETCTKIFNGDTKSNILSLKDLELSPQNDDIEKLLSVALMTGNIEVAVDICLKQNRSGEATILAVSSGRQDLYEKVQNKILQASAKIYPTAQLISVAVKHNWHDLVENCDVKDWRESLAWLLTYVSVEDLGDLYEILGRRLEEKSQEDVEYLFAACICYICSGSVASFVRCWLNCKTLSNNKELQRLMEMVVLLCKTIGDDDMTQVKGESANLLTKYASIVASQGHLAAALTYLGDNNEQDVLILRDRISQNLRDHQLPPGIKKPVMPFKISPLLNTISKKPQNICTNDQFMHKPIQRELGVYSSVPKISKPIVDSQLRMNDTSHVPRPNLMTPSFNNKMAKILPNSPNNTSTNFYPPLSMNSFVPSNSSFVSSLPTQCEKRSNLYTSTTVSSQLSPAILQQTQSQGIQSNKPSWNDPPLLSENYKSDQEKRETNVQQQFYNPNEFTSANCDMPSLNNQLDTTSSSVTSYVHPTVQAVSNIISSQKTDTVPTELSLDKQHWRRSLNNVIELCRQRDNSRQTKVKMEDIQKKLDNWFDQLKTKTVSPELLCGLETLISLIDLNNFRESLDKVNQIMQNVNFSEAGSFLPSLKMLIQYAIKVAV